MYDPDAGLVTAMVGCEDGHAQERAALPAVLGLVRPREVWVADLYRKRWTIETAFAELAKTLSGEIDALGYPRAALFGFGLALAAANVLAAVKAAVRAAHQDATDEVSGYYLADELAGTSRGMMIAIGPKAWAVSRASTTRAWLASSRGSPVG